MPQPVSIEAMLNLTPREAVDYMRDKGYRLGWNWYDVWREQHARAFTVAKIMRMDALTIIESAVTEAINEGLTQRDFIKRLRDTFVVGGFVDENALLTARRMETIFRTNMQVAYNVGRWRTFVANADDRPYIQYLTIQDANVRDSHRALHGKVFHISDPVWSYISPPNGYNCRCRARAFTQEQIDSRGLTVESGEGRIVNRTVTVGGEDRGNTGYQDPITGENIYPDPGWDTNPAENTAPPGQGAPQEPLTPDYDRYTPEIAAAGQRDVNPYTQPEPPASEEMLLRLLKTLIEGILAGRGEAPGILGDAPVSFGEIQ